MTMVLTNYNPLFIEAANKHFQQKIFNPWLIDFINCWLEFQWKESFQ